jgi:uncharacterized protein (DUF58 family)
MFKFLKSKQSNDTGLQTPTQTPINAQALLARMAWTSAKRLDGLMQGDYRTLFKGAGMMLADLREYLPHDDVRHMDWNVTARMQTPYVREHEQDRDLTAWFLVDLSASIGFGSGSVSKRTIMAEAVALLGHLLQRRGNRVGAVIDRADPKKNLDIIPARSGKRHLLHLLHRLLNQPLHQSPTPTSLKRLLTGAQRIVGRRSTVFIISDFLTAPDWDKALIALASRHDVVAIRLVDPMDQQLPNMGMLTLRDAETNQQVFVDSGDPGFRRRFAQQTQDHEKALLRSLTRAGVDCLELSTDSTAHEDLMQFIGQRQRFLRQASMGPAHV